MIIVQSFYQGAVVCWTLWEHRPDVSDEVIVITITKNGYPVAELRPFSGGRRESPFGLHKGLKIQGDIISPPEDERWEALE